MAPMDTVVAILLVVLLVLWFVLWGVVCGFLAARKGRSYAAGFAWGFLLTWFGVLIVTLGYEDRRRRCHECTGRIGDDHVRVCPWCYASLRLDPAYETARRAVTTPPAPTPRPYPTGHWPGETTT